MNHSRKYTMIFLFNIRESNYFSFSMLFLLTILISYCTTHDATKDVIHLPCSFTLRLETIIIFHIVSDIATTSHSKMPIKRTLRDNRLKPNTFPLFKYSGFKLLKQALQSTLSIMKHSFSQLIVQ